MKLENFNLKGRSEGGAMRLNTEHSKEDINDSICNKTQESLYTRSS
jgi:hypothetical protein